MQRLQTILTRLCLDDEGHILYIGSDDLYETRGLLPGSSIVIKEEISSAFMEYFNLNGINPSSVDAIAYIDK